MRNKQRCSADPPSSSSKLVEAAAEAKGQPAGRWRSWTDVIIRKAIELGVGVGTGKTIGYGLSGLAGEDARSASVEALALPSPESTLPRNPPRTSCCSPTSSFSSVSARSLSSSLA